MEGLVVGKTVHYVVEDESAQIRCRAAIVTHVGSLEAGVVNLTWARDYQLDDVGPTDAPWNFALGVHYEPLGFRRTWHLVHEGDLPALPQPEPVTTLDLEPATE